MVSVLGSTFFLLSNNFCWEYVFVLIKGVSVLGILVISKVVSVGENVLIIKRVSVLGSTLLNGFLCRGVLVIIKVVSVLGSTFLLLLKGFLCWVVRFCYY